MKMHIKIKNILLFFATFVLTPSVFSAITQEDLDALPAPYSSLSIVGGTFKEEASYLGRGYCADVKFNVIRDAIDIAKSNKDLITTDVTAFRLLEVGTSTGESAIKIGSYLRDNYPGSILYTVDDWRAYGNEDLTQFLSNVVHEGLTEIIKPIFFDSLILREIVTGEGQPTHPVITVTNPIEERTSNSFIFPSIRLLAPMVIAALDVEATEAITSTLNGVDWSELMDINFVYLDTDESQQEMLSSFASIANLLGSRAVVVVDDCSRSVNGDTTPTKSLFDLLEASAESPLNGTVTYHEIWAGLGDWVGVFELAEEVEEEDPGVTG
jgi:predicted O-methyltransferase YrrM